MTPKLAARRKLPWIVALLVLALALAAGAFQKPQPIPIFDGDGDSSHEGQPAWCQNADSGGYAHNCDCQPHMGDKACADPDRGAENSRCAVYCRKTSCRCRRECERTR